MQDPKTYHEVSLIISQVRFRDKNIVLIDKEGVWFLQVQYYEEDVHTKNTEEQHGRKWYISPHMTESEIVQTAFKAVLTSQEHIAREWFTYKGRRIFHPHHNINNLIRLCDEHTPDLRS